MGTGDSRFLLCEAHREIREQETLFTERQFHLAGRLYHFGFPPGLVGGGARRLSRSHSGRLVLDLEGVAQ